MTKKRFTIVNMGLDGQYIKENGKIMTIERVVDLLNENEQLKQKHRQLQIDFNDACSIVHDLRENKLDLEDENEQLKKELYDITIDYYTETYFDNSVRRDEHIKDFKEEFKAKYGDVE